MTLSDIVRLVALAAIWGGSYMLMRYAAPFIDTAWLSELRVGLAAIAMLAYARFAGVELRVRERWRIYAVMGVINTALPWSMYVWAGHHISASYMAILNATTPTLIAMSELNELRAGAPLPSDSLVAYASDSLRKFWEMAAELPPKPTAAELAGTHRLFAKRVALVAALQHAGVPILAGSDAPVRASMPGWSLHDELEWLVKAGLTPLEALRSATSEPARYFAADSLGAVARGKVADFVVLDADPRLDIANTRKIAVVVANGRVYDAAARRELLARARRAAGHQ